MSYTIKEVAKKFNLTPYTLRYYENSGLLPFVNRDSKGKRIYSDQDLKWIYLICCMRSTGMSISFIKNYVDLCMIGEETIPERRQIILKQKEIIENHIEELNKYLKVINKKLKYYDDLVITQQQDVINPNVK